MGTENDDAPEDQSGDANDNQQKQSSTGFRRKAIGFFAMVSSDIFSNPKIVAAGPHGALNYFHALCRNAARERTGVLPASDMAPAYVSRVVGISQEEARQALSACVEVGLLDVTDNEVHIVGWDESWKRGPLTEAERIRKAKYRAGKKAESDSDSEPEKKKKKKETQNRGKRDMSGDMSGTSTQEGSFSLQVWIPPPGGYELLVIAGLLDALSNITGIVYTHDNPSYQGEIVARLREGVPYEDLEGVMYYLADIDGRHWSSEDNPCSKHLANPTIVFSAKTVQSNVDAAIRGDWRPRDYEYWHSSWGERVSKYRWIPEL